MNFKKLALSTALIASSLLPLAAMAAPIPESHGSFVSGVHTTTGTATIYRLDSGTRILRLSNFSTSNGPKVHVVLTDHTVTGNNVIDAHSIDLGDLKGTDGNQNYTIPSNANIADVKSVAIYCERFHVTFGSAKLK